MVTYKATTYGLMERSALSGPNRLSMHISDYFHLTNLFTFIQHKSKMTQIDSFLFHFLQPAY